MPVPPVRRFLPLALGLLLAGSTRAQPPTIIFGGTVRVDRLDVRELDGVRVRLIGADTMRRVVRENVPARLQPGQTYRDVRVRFEYRVSVAALDSVLRPLMAPRPAAPDTARRYRP